MSQVVEIKKAIEVHDQLMQDWWSLCDQDVVAASYIPADPLNVGSGYVAVGWWPTEEDVNYREYRKIYRSDLISPYPSIVAISEWEQESRLLGGHPYVKFIYGGSGDNVFHKVMAALRPWFYKAKYIGVGQFNNWSAKREMLLPRQLYAGNALQQLNPRRSGVWRTRAGTRDRIIRRVNTDRWKDR